MCEHNYKFFPYSFLGEDSIKEDIEGALPELLL